MELILKQRSPYKTSKTIKTCRFRGPKSKKPAEFAAQGTVRQPNEPPIMSPAVFVTMSGDALNLPFPVQHAKGKEFNAAAPQCSRCCHGNWWKLKFSFWTFLTRGHFTCVTECANYFIRASVAVGQAVIKHLSIYLFSSGEVNFRTLEVDGKLGSVMFQ